MIQKHYFIPALDAGDLLPFGIHQKKSFQDEVAEQERARQELVKFVECIEKHAKQKMFYLGMDVIGEKSYERFLIENGGFFEAMVETPVALNAHFCTEKEAKSFLKALQKALRDVLPKGPLPQMFIDSLSVEHQEDMTLAVSSWNKMKHIRKK